MDPLGYGRLGLVVVNFGSHELIEANLGPMSEDLEDVEVTIVDNFKSPADRAAIGRACGRRGWNLLPQPTNLGFGGGANAGAEAAFANGARQVLFLNPDARLDPASLKLMRERALSEPMALVAPRILDASGAVWSQGSDLLLHAGHMRSWAKRDPESQEEYIPWLSGACLLASRELWQAVGGFTDEYFLYWEDVDLSVRVQRVGGRLALEGGATAVHDEGRTHDDANHDPRVKSELYYYYNIRNRVLFAALNLDEETLRRWMRNAPKEDLEILLRGGRRQFIRPVKPLRAAVRGSLAARRIGLARLREYSEAHNAA